MFLAMMIELRLAALPPGWLTPPAYVPLKPYSSAMLRVVAFSIKVSAGETW